MDFEPVPNQEFDAGRIIDITECIDKGCNLDKCDYMNCKNYCVEMRQRKISIEEFFNDHKKELDNINYYNLVGIKNEFNKDYVFEMTEYLIEDMFERVGFDFPNNTHYYIDNPIYGDNIVLSTCDDEGEEIDIAYIRVKNGVIEDFELDDDNFELAARIRKALRYLKKMTYEAVVEDYESQNREEKIE